MNADENEEEEEEEEEGEEGADANAKTKTKAKTFTMEIEKGDEETGLLVGSGWLGTFLKPRGQRTVGATRFIDEED